ncbi:hypothetical protein TURU_033715 [Turdus rufiventris]|nr:hypothetical protein TURU_033715 [Turdus rufiventris]
MRETLEKIYQSACQLGRREERREEKRREEKRREEKRREEKRREEKREEKRREEKRREEKRREEKRREEKRREEKKRKRNHYVLEEEKLHMWTLGWISKRAPPKVCCSAILMDNLYFSSVFQYIEAGLLWH